LARALRYRLGYPVISSDQVRKHLAGVAESHVRQGYGDGIYSPAFTDRTYQAVLEEAAEELKNGSAVVVDATFKDLRHRTRARDLAMHCCAPVLFVECRASDAEIRRRLGKRSQDQKEASDATISTYERQVLEFVPLGEIPDASHIVVDAAEAL